jgi:hypothetical protein
MYKKISSFAAPMKTAQTKKATLSDRLFRVPPAGAVMFGRHNWIRTNDPHHVKVVL